MILLTYSLYGLFGKINMRIKSADPVIYSLMLVLAVFSTYKLFLDKNDHLFSGPQTSIGKVTNYINTFKIKKNEITNWRDALAGQKLSTGDVVYTHENSSASIRIDTLGDLSLSSNTLIKLSNLKDKPSFIIQKGGVDAVLKNNSSITLVINGQEVKISGEKSKVRIQNNKGKYKIAVKSGKAKIQVNNESIAVNEMQNLIIDTKNDIQKEDIIAIPSKPSADDLLYDSHQVLFKWQRYSKKEPTLLTITKNNQKIHSFKITENEKLISLSAGEYQWSICTLREIKNNLCVKEKFTVLNELEPMIYSLPSNGTIPFDSENVINIFWNETSFAKYKVSIVGPNQLEEFETVKPFLNYLFKEAGKYHISIQNIISGKTSKIFQKEIDVIKLKNLPKPSLQIPDESEMIQFFENKFKTTFKWDKVEGATNYTLEIKKENEVLSFNSHSNAAFLNLKEGNYTWRIKASSANNESLFSEWRSVSLKKASYSVTPSGGVEIELDRPDQTVEFKWVSENYQKNHDYVFEISKDEEFSSLIYQQATKEQSINHSFNEKGVFFWRARVKSTQGEFSVSTPVRVKIKPSPISQPIKLKDRIKYKILKKDNLLDSIMNIFFPIAHASEDKIKIQWEENKKAKTYFIEIFADPNAEILLHKTQTTDNFFDWSFPPNVENFYWRIRFTDHWDRVVPFSNLSQGVIDFKSNYYINQISPKHNISIDSNDALKFTWDSNVNSHLFLEFSKSLNFSNPIKRIKISSKGTTYLKYSQISIQNGYWRIISNNQKIISKRRFFNFQNTRSNRVANLKIANKKYHPTYNNFDIYLLPTSISHESSNTNKNIHVSGTALNSFLTNFKSKKQYQIQLERKSGSVFNEESYHIIRLNADVKNKFFELYNFHYGVLVSSYPTLSVTNNTVTTSQKLLLATTLRYTKYFNILNDKDIEFNNTIHIGNNYGLSSSIIYNLSDYLLRVSFNYFKFDFENYENSSKEISLGFGYRWKY